MRALRFCGFVVSRLFDCRPNDSGVVAAIE
jgi:hypothetical protein